MGKFIIGTFAIMAWAFYVMSGGANFVPEARMASADTSKTEVTRARSTEMIAVIKPVAVKPMPAVAITPAAPATAPVQDVANLPVSRETAPAFGGTNDSIVSIDPTLTSLSAPAPAATASPDLLTIREVAARAVNMREGPDTSYAVIDTLPQGTQTQVVETDGNGWVRVRIIGTGQMGWVAERLLTAG